MKIQRKYRNIIKLIIFCSIITMMFCIFDFKNDYKKSYELINKINTNNTGDDLVYNNLQDIKQFMIKR